MYYIGDALFRNKLFQNVMFIRLVMFLCIKDVPFFIFCFTYMCVCVCVCLCVHVWVPMPLCSFLLFYLFNIRFWLVIAIGDTTCNLYN